jgi:phospholipase/carboxylesterase
MGREWFPLTLTDPREFWSGVTYAAPKLDAFLDRELARYSLPASQLGLVGFSQGAMMALHIGLRREPAPAAIIGYSGLLVLEGGQGPESLQRAARSKPPILLVHGGRDDVVPVEMFLVSKEALGAAGIPANGTSRLTLPTESTRREFGRAACSWHRPSASPPLGQSRRGRPQERHELRL